MNCLICELSSMLQFVPQKIIRYYVNLQNWIEPYIYKPGLRYFYSNEYLNPLVLRVREINNFCPIKKNWYIFAIRDPQITNPCSVQKFIHDSGRIFG